MTVTEQKQRWQGMAILKHLVILFAGFAAAAASANGYHPMRFNHITLDDGLSQSTVLSVLQDSKGMIWIGTENGLNRYNGYEFEVFQRERGNPDALSSDFVFDIEQDADGNLWLATNGGGLVKRDARTGKFSALRHDPADAGSISGNVVRSLLLDDDGMLWLGHRAAGLERLNSHTGVVKNYGLDAAAGGANTIYALLQDSAGNVWAGGDHGLTRIDGRTGDVFTYTHDAANAASVSKHPVRAVAEDDRGRIWVGSYGGGLSRLQADGSGFDHFRHDPERATSLSSDRVSTLFVDAEKRLWAGTTAGLNLVDTGSGAVARFAHDSGDGSSLGADDVMTIYQDRSGLMWFGTKTRGVDTWNPRTWSLGFEPAKEVAVDAERQPNVTSFAVDPEGILWIGTFGDGLNALDRETGEITRYRSAPGGKYLIGDDRVMSLLRDREGNIWAGTMTSGITLIDPEAGTSEVFRHDPADAKSLSANGVMKIYEDRDGRIWVGTFGGGINVYEPASKSFRRILADADKPGSLSSNRVTALAEDPSGRMWVGTEGGGLNLYNPATGKFSHFRHDPVDPETLAADTVYAINVDADGTVWIGTHGGGLDRVIGDVSRPDAIRFANVSRKEGLANNVIYGIQFDDAGWLWLSTNHGISRYNPATGEIRNLHRRDGLQSEEFNFGAHYRSPEGELFFGGHNGYNAFQPDELAVNSTAPLIALTGFFNANDPKGSGLPDDAEGVEISWKDDNVAFEFAALDYTAPQSNRYMYKLEGFDKDWIDLGNRRLVTYTDLNDGKYLLRVKAANSDGVWNEIGYTIPVTVKPAPWDTWWAYLGYVGFAVQLGGFLWLGHRRKIAREEQYSRRLENEVSVRTDKLIEQNRQLNDLNKALQESSLSDPLTGLRNRRFVFEEVSRDIDGIRRKLEKERDGTLTFDTSELVFMMIDMDNFKPINDTYGHAAGDEVLLQFRDLLLGVCRKSDFVIRWGGDEFVVIARQASAAESEALAERIRSTVANHSFVLADGQVVHTTCSIGFAAYPLFRSTVDESGLDQIMSLADNLMYEAKKSRNAWVGMMGPNKASTSADVDHDAIESTSVLFRARHTGNLARHGSQDNEDHGLPRIGKAAS
jgi:diguanylate cyclase (GGDEF)-like protein